MLARAPPVSPGTALAAALSGAADAETSWLSGPRPVRRALPHSSFRAATRHAAQIAGLPTPRAPLLSPSRVLSAALSHAEDADVSWLCGGSPVSCSPASGRLTDAANRRPPPPPQNMGRLRALLFGGVSAEPRQQQLQGSSPGSAPARRPLCQLPGGMDEVGSTVSNESGAEMLTVAADWRVSSVKPFGAMSGAVRSRRGIQMGRSVHAESPTGDWGAEALARLAPQRPMPALTPLNVPGQRDPGPGSSSAQRWLDSPYSPAGTLSAGGTPGRVMAASAAASPSHAPR